MSHTRVAMRGEQSAPLLSGRLSARSAMTFIVVLMLLAGGLRRSLQTLLTSTPGRTLPELYRWGLETHRDPPECYSRTHMHTPLQKMEVELTLLTTTR